MWKKIKEFDHYEVNSDGVIRNTRTNRIVKQSLVANGRLMVSLYDGKRRKTDFVSRIVAECFCEKPLDSQVVHHKDKNPLNNKADNLEWTTYKRNSHYRYGSDPKDEYQPTKKVKKLIDEAMSLGLLTKEDVELLFETKIRK